VRVEINEDLLRQVRAIAKEHGLTEVELVEAAVASYIVVMGGSDPEALFDRIDLYQRLRGVELLSEDEAMRLANEELHAMRRERGSTQ